MGDTVCIVSTVRAPVNELMIFVKHHIAAGVDKLILCFDDANDVAVKCLGDIPEVISIVCDAAYWSARGIDRPESIEQRQVANANFAMEIARARGYDWIIHIDCDELLLSDDAIRVVLSGYSADVVRFDMKEAVAERDHYASRFEATLFREPLTAEGMRRLACISPSDLQDVLFEGEYFRGHAISKVAVRLNSRLEQMGIHRPMRPEIFESEVQTSEVVLLHYDCIGIDDWKRKWLRRIDGSATAAGIRPARTKQFNLFKEVCGDEMKERDLYCRLHKISQRQRELLLELGLLTVIRPRSHMLTIRAPLSDDRLLLSETWDNEP